jgi:adenylate cyclase
MVKVDYRTTKPPRVRRKGKIERRLAAILAADIRGYSALIGSDEEDAHRRVGSDITRVMKEIERSQGRIFTFAGDGLVAEFPSAVAALRCAQRIQGDTTRRNARQSPERWIAYRIGINSGEIMVEGERTGGNAVNIAVRLEQLAEPGGIHISRAVYDQVKGVIPAEYVPLGQHVLKNIREPVPVYRVVVGHRAPNGGTGAQVPRGPFALAASVADYRPSLAVLPFRTLLENQQDAYFAEGMVDDVIRLLGGLKDLVVVSRSSTLGYARATPDLRRIGQELNVQYVLHGSVRRAGQQLRIAVELDEVESQQSIWADRFDGAMSDIFELQDQIALRTASSIAPHVRDREIRRAALKDQNSINAYDLTLQALEHVYPGNQLALARAEALLQRAIALDSNYPTALSHLAYLHVFRIGQGLSTDEHAERLAAAEAASRAVDRDRNDALALAIHGHLRGYLRKDHEAALATLDRAITLGPSCALAWTFASLTCGITGDTAAALTRARTALRLSPIGPDAGCWHEHAYSQANYLAGDYEEAIAWAQTAARHGLQTSNLRCLAASLVAVDRVHEARDVAHKILEANPRFRLATFRAYTPLKGSVADLFIERLRLTGLPE